MKIAIIGSAIFPSPSAKGIIHAPLKLSFELAKQLVERGHEVLFYGQVNSEAGEVPFKVENFDYNPDLYKDVKGYRIDFFVAYEQGFLMRVLKSLKDTRVDLVYYYVPFRIGSLAGLTDLPVVATHHDATHVEEYNLMYPSFTSKNLFLIPISQAAKEGLNYPQYLDVVHNGVNVNQIKVVEKEDYFAWVGRIVPEKGVHIAVDLAKELGIKLKIAGPMQKYNDFSFDEDYFEKAKRDIEENDNIEYVGVLSQEETYNFLAKAKGLIFPSDGTESCPMVAIESMVAGTPVITSPKGPLPELVKDGITGFLCNNIDDYKEAVRNIKTINLENCRDWAIKHFSIEVMAEGYEREFKKAVEIYSQRPTSS